MARYQQTTQDPEPRPLARLRLPPPERLLPLPHPRRPKLPKSPRSSAKGSSLPVTSSATSSAPASKPLRASPPFLPTLSARAKKAAVRSARRNTWRLCTPLLLCLGSPNSDSVNGTTTPSLDPKAAFEFLPTHGPTAWRDPKEVIGYLKVNGAQIGGLPHVLDVEEDGNWAAASPGMTSGDEGETEGEAEVETAVSP